MTVPGLKTVEPLHLAEKGVRSMSPGLIWAVCGAFVAPCDVTTERSGVTCALCLEFADSPYFPSPAQETP